MNKQYFPFSTSKHLITASFLCLLLFSSAYADQVRDAYIKGYVAAILERDFGVLSTSLTVTDGVVSLTTYDLRGVDQEQVASALSRIDGVQRVEIQSNVYSPAKVVEGSAPASASVGSLSKIERGVFLPKGQLFAPLFASPSWPAFAATYRYYLRDKELRNVGAANFGATIPLYRNRAPFNGQWELGLQAGVFSIFDLDAKSKDLINSDFFVGAFSSYRLNDTSAMLRLYHESSHLGDEFLLRNRVKRINLSYEVLDLTLSQKFFDFIRIYGGGGYLFDEEPPTLKSWVTHFGTELESPWSFANDILQPIVGADFRLHEEHAWSTDFSIRGGVRLKNPLSVSRRLAVLGEYFKGHSPNGQFYQRKVEYLGLGIYYYF